MAMMTRLRRLALNFWRDIRHGGFLGGGKKTLHADDGAYDTANSGYEALQRIFADPRVRALLQDRAIVDVGCGKGRVLNFLLDAFPGQKIIGIEIDEDVANQVSRRLRKYLNVTIWGGDFRKIGLPEDAIFYMFNPFDASVMSDFAERFSAAAPTQGAVIYYNPMHRTIFDENSRFRVETIPLEVGFHECLLITPRDANLPG